MVHFPVFEIIRDNGKAGKKSSFGIVIAILKMIKAVAVYS
jgi:hypothetical protein